MIISIICGFSSIEVTMGLFIMADICEGEGICPPPGMPKGLPMFPKGLAAEAEDELELLALALALAVGWDVALGVGVD